MRESFEETGLSDLTLHSFLGEQQRDMRDVGRAEIHQRAFYHLQHHGGLTPPWRHEERSPSDLSESEPLLFELFWAPLPHGVPPLIADQGIMLPQLLKRLAQSAGL